MIGFIPVRVAICNKSLTCKIEQIIPENAKQLALNVAQSCRWDDVGIDICEHNGQFYILEANMKYGREGFRMAGLDYDRLMESMIENEEI